MVVDWFDGFVAVEGIPECPYCEKNEFRRDMFDRLVCKNCGRIRDND